MKKLSWKKGLAWLLVLTIIFSSASHVLANDGGESEPVAVSTEGGSSDQNQSGSGGNADQGQIEQPSADQVAAEEAARLEAEKAAAEEAARLEAEKAAAEEAARLEAEKAAAEAAAKLEAEKVAAEAAAKLEAEKVAAEAAAKLEAEKIAAGKSANISEATQLKASVHVGNNQPQILNIENGIIVGLTDPAPADGQKFDGWFTSSDFVETSRLVNSGLIANINLYAKFIPVEAAQTPAIIITLSVNGMEYPLEANAAIPAEPDKNTMPWPENAASFKGWFTAAVDGEKIGTNATFTENKTLYAQFEEKKAEVAEPKITLMVDGKQYNAKVEIKNGELTADIAEPAKSFWPADVEYFRGWFDQAADGGVKIIAGHKFTEDQTLYAQFRKKEVINHPVTFVNGTEKVVQKVADGVSLPASLNVAPATKPDGVGEFIGWYTAATGGELYDFDTPVIKPFSLYARYDEPTTFTVSYEVPEGTVGEVPVDNIAYTAGKEAVVLSGELLTNGEKVFAGWKSDLDNEIYNQGQTITINKDTTLTATFADAYYTVTFKSGLIGDNLQKDVVLHISKESPMVTMLSQDTFTHPEGARFDGWESEGYSKLAAGEKTEIQGDVTFTATWDTSKIKLTITTLDTVGPFTGQPMYPDKKNISISDGLPAGYTVEPTFATDSFVTFVTDGKVDSKIESVIIKDSTGEDVTNRFVPAFENTGKLYLTKTKVYVRPDTQSLVYNGKEQSYTKDVVLMWDGREYGEKDRPLILYDSYSINLKIEVKGIDVDDYVGEPVAKDPSRAGIIYQGDVDRSENFELRKAAASHTLTITPLTVTVTGKTSKVPYTGKAQTLTGVDASGLLPGHTITFNPEPSVTGTLPGVYPLVVDVNKALINGTGSQKNYIIKANNGLLTIDNGNLPWSIEGNSASYDYDGQKHTLPNFENSDKTWKVVGLPDGITVKGITVTDPEATNVKGDTYTQVFDYSNATFWQGEDNVTASFSRTPTVTPGKLTIKPIDLTITPEVTPKSINNKETKEPQFELKYEGFAKPDNKTNAFEKEPVIDKGGFEFISGKNVAGIYDITASGAVAKGGNYNIIYGKRDTLTVINVGTLAYSANGFPFEAPESDGEVYAENAKAPVNTTDISANGYKFLGWSTTPDGAVMYQVGEANQSKTFTAADAANGVTLYAVGEADFSNNYDFYAEPHKSAYNGKNVTDDVPPVPKSITVKNILSGDTIYYALTNAVGADGKLSNGTTDNPAYTNVGEYTVYYQVQRGKNFSEVKSAAVTITKAPITITADNDSKVYGTADPETFTAKITEGTLSGEDTLKYTPNRVKGEPVGTYDIDVTVEENPNYEVTVKKGIFTITPKEVTIKPIDSTKVYGSDDPEFTATVTGTVENDTLDYQIVRKPGENVDSYELSVEPGNNPNYDIKVETGTFTITPLEATITPIDSTKVYGEADPEFTATVTGTVLDDKLNYKLVREEGEDVDDYVISVIPEENPNYDIKVATGTFTITPLQVTITPNQSTKVYGSEDPTFTATVAGIADGDITDYTIVRVPGENVGTYELSVTLGQELQNNPNYNIQIGTNDFTITPAPITLTADNNGKVYGAVDPELTATATGAIKAGDTLNYTVSREAGENAADYPINVTLGENPNYQITVVPGIFTIAPVGVNVIITPDSSSKIYGDADPEFTATVTGTVNGEQLDYTIERTPGENVGEYVLNVILGNNPNYVIQVITNTFTIIPAEAIITVGDAAKIAGATDPAFSATAAGAKNGETLDYTLARTAGEGTGTYPITAQLTAGSSINANYRITIIDGTLTITPAAVTPETPTTPETPEEPTPPTPPTTPTTPETTTPATPTPATPTPATPGTTTPAPAAPAAPAPIPVGPVTLTAQPQIVNEEALADGETPLAGLNEETIGDNDTALAAGLRGGAWALLNLILTILTAIAMIILLVGYFMGRKKNEEEDEENLEAKEVHAEEEEESEEELKRKGVARLLSIVPAIFAVIAFILTEDMRNPMVFVDSYTLLMAIIALVQAVLVFLSVKKRNEEEKEDETEPQSN